MVSSPDGQGRMHGKKVDHPFVWKKRLTVFWVTFNVGRRGLRDIPKLIEKLYLLLGFDLDGHRHEGQTLEK